MTIQVWCSFQFFQQASAETRPVMVSDGRMTTDIVKSNWQRPQAGAEQRTILGASAGWERHF